MNAHSKDLQALLTRVLSKTFIAVESLTSLRDVPIILEEMVIRLTFLEYAIFFSRQRQSSGSHVWRLLFSDKYLYFFFKDVLLGSHKQLIRNELAHTHLEDTQASSLRETSGTGIYELAADPAKTVLRKILESSLRMLVEGLVSSDAAIQGSWPDVCPPKTPQRTLFGLRDALASISKRTDTIPRTLSVSVTDSTAQAYSSNEVSLSSKAAHLHPGPDRTALGMIKLLLDAGSRPHCATYKSAQLSFRIHISNASSSIDQSWAGVFFAIGLTIADFEDVADICSWLLPKFEMSRTDSRKFVHLLRSIIPKDFALEVVIKKSEEGSHVLLRPAKPRQMETDAFKHVTNDDFPGPLGLIYDDRVSIEDCDNEGSSLHHYASLWASVEVSNHLVQQGLNVSSDDPMLRIQSGPATNRSGPNSSNPVKARRFGRSLVKLLRQKSNDAPGENADSNNESLLPIHRWLPLPHWPPTPEYGVPSIDSTVSTGLYLPRYQITMHTTSPWLAQSVIASKNGNSVHKLDAETTHTPGSKVLREAGLRVREDTPSDGRLSHDRRGSITERLETLPERWRGSELHQTAGSSDTHDRMTDSSSTLEGLRQVYMGLRITTNPLGFWRHFTIGKLSRRNFSRMMRPRVPQGHARLTWICHCGKELYGDFDNSDPSAVARLAHQLQKHTRAIDACSVTTHSTTTSTTAQKVVQSSPASSSTSLTSNASANSSTSSYLSASSSRTSQTSASQVQPPPPCHTKASMHTSSNSPGLIGMGHSPVPSAPYVPQQKQYVEICVNTGQHYQRLAEIDVARHKTDAELFRWIRKRYVELRGWRTKWQYFLRPQAMSYVEFALDRKRKVHIYQHKNAYPPKAEIDAGRYKYNMPPPPIPSNTFIHYLRECDLDSYSGPQDNEILEIIAKKLDTRVSDNPSLSTKAYGMLVHEGPDITAILWTMTIMVVVMCGPLIAFIIVTKDVQSATGLAAAALAVMTLLWMGMQVDRAMNFAD